MAPITLVREPWSAVILRLVSRSVIPALGLYLAGVPGAGRGPVTTAWQRVVIWVVAALALLGLLLALANLIARKRKYLVFQPTGSIERPLSLQERAFRRPPDFVTGSTVSVRTAIASLAPSSKDPRVSFQGGGRTLASIPLFGTPVADFIAKANAELKGRGVELTLVEPAAPPAGPDAE